MGIGIIATGNQAVFYSSSTEWAFGPVMPDEDVAEAFLRTFQRPDDPRLLDDTELEKRWNEFQRKLACPKGHTNDTAVSNYGGGVTHFHCMNRDCHETWDLDGNVIVEDEDEEAA